MKIFLINWGHRESATADIAHDLEKIGHKVIYWVRSNKYFSVDKSKYPNTIIHDWHDAAVLHMPKGIDKEQFPVPSKELLAMFSAQELIALCMLDRDYPDYSVSQKREIYHDHFRFWHGLITQKNPDVIIMSDIPHRVVDFMIYSIAKKLDIPIIIFGFTAISDRNYVIRDFEQGFKTIFTSGAQAVETDLSPDILAYFKSQISEAADNTPFPMKEQAKQFSNFSIFKKKILHIPKLIITFNFIGPLKRNISGLATILGLSENMLHKYKHLEKTPDYSAKYVYIPLHYQPERTTMPQGNVYMDQLLMIRTVSAALPKGWKIYVKEHRSQFFFAGRKPSKFRSTDYYERIAQIPHVTLVPLSEDSFRLIKNSQAVATVTGTAAWEAVFRAIPALIFGAPWYLGCPGTVRVSSVEECREFFQKVISGYTVSRQELINFLYFLDINTFHGYLQVPQHKQSKLIEAENKENILKIILEEFEEIQTIKFIHKKV